MNEIEVELREFLRENFFIDQEVALLSSSQSLTGTGVVDSTGVLEIIMFLERRFGLSIPDEDMTPENLDTLENITRYVEATLETPSAQRRLDQKQDQAQ